MVFSELGAAAETVPFFIEHVSLEAKWSEDWPDCGFWMHRHNTLACHRRHAKVWKTRGHVALVKWNT